MKVFLYVLKNAKSCYYVGITALSLEQRLLRHNHGNVKSTRDGRPWEILCFEEFGTVQEARQREKQIKSWHGGNAFKKFLAKAAGSSNGRTWAFEAQYPGPNPGPAALSGNMN